MPINQKYFAKEIWDKSSINKTVKTIISAKDGKHPLIRMLDKCLIWVILGVATIGSFVAAAAFMPFLFILPALPLYIALGVIGLVIGIFFEFLIANAENIETRHHFYIMILLPVVSIFNFLYVIKGVQDFGLSVDNNLLLIGGAVYVAFFLAPYLVYEFWLKKI